LKEVKFSRDKSNAEAVDCCSSRARAHEAALGKRAPRWAHILVQNLATKRTTPTVGVVSFVPKLRLVFGIPFWDARSEVQKTAGHVSTGIYGRHKMPARSTVLMTSNGLLGLKLWETSMESTAKTNEIGSKREAQLGAVAHCKLLSQRPAHRMHE
jgi:hypothetical protein